MSILHSPFRIVTQLVKSLLSRIKRTLLSDLLSFFARLSMFNGAAFNERVLKKYCLSSNEFLPLKDILTDLANDDKWISESFNKYATHCHKEWVFDMREPVYIEAKRGLIFSSRGKLLEKSFS